MDTIGTDWTAEDWIADYEERAGIQEYDGNLARMIAEAFAFKASVQKYAIAYGLDYEASSMALKEMGVGAAGKTA